MSMLAGNSVVVVASEIFGVHEYIRDLCRRLAKAGFAEKDMQNITWDRYIEIGKKVEAATGKKMLGIDPNDNGLVRVMMQSGGRWYFDKDGKPIERKVTLTRLDEGDGPAPTVAGDSGKPAEAASLRLIARQTWRFFETFVTEADNMLPPDNFQERPEPVVARRTSPTNIGVYLLSVVSARHFGWLSFEQTIEKLEQTIGTLDKMVKLRGQI